MNINYIALTQPTANWLLANKSYLEDLHAILPDLLNVDALSDGVLASGTFRAAASREAGNLCAWNTDYLSGSGVEQWGFIRLSEQMGLFAEERISLEVLERCLYVVNQRLQGLLVGDDRMIHRSWENNVHTCLAGRGDEARHFSIAFTEGNFPYKNASARAILCVGPANDFQALAAAASTEKERLPRLVLSANGLLVSSAHRPTLDLSSVSSLNVRFQPKYLKETAQDGPVADVPSLSAIINDDAVNQTAQMTYGNWMAEHSPLTNAQRRIVESDVLLKQPIRIVGAAGSGKSLVMQLLAMRRLHESLKRNERLSILYVVHNSAMMSTIWDRFATLGAERFFEKPTEQRLHVDTLFGHSQEALQLDSSAIIDTDAYQTKQFQVDTVTNALQQVLEHRGAELDRTIIVDGESRPEYPLIRQIAKRSDLVPLFSELVATEIGVAIKGHGLSDNRKRYVGSEQALSRLHGVLTPSERQVIFDVFEQYHREVFHTNGVLDSDDVAISLLGQLRTPLWNLKRQKTGHDFVFVDETQLFNENERRLFSLLTKGNKNYVPIALALDEAQELRGSVSPGFGLLGIESIADESLQTVHRSTKSIIALAFYVIQRTTDLFGPEFPDFTASTEAVISDDHPLASLPTVIEAGPEVQNFGKFVLRQARALRKRNLRQVCIVVHADRYWDEVYDAITKEDRGGDSVLVLTRRGERVDSKKPIIVLTRPENVGGQEFDAVIGIGLEQGLVPPKVDGHDGLATALEQQALREMYLTFTRARYRLVLALPRGGILSGVLQPAVTAGLLATATSIR